MHIVSLNTLSSEMRWLYRDVTLTPDEPFVVPPHALVRIDCSGHHLHVHLSKAAHHGKQGCAAMYLEAFQLGTGAVVTLQNCRVAVHVPVERQCGAPWGFGHGHLIFEASTAELLCEVRRAFRCIGARLARAHRSDWSRLCSLALCRRGPCTWR